MTQKSKDVVLFRFIFLFNEVKEISQYRVSENFLGLEGVDEPHGNVADKQEGDSLARGLAALLFGKVHAAARHVSNEQQLKNHLEVEQLKL